MTTAVDRPNRNKLQQGIDIYRDHVREFIVRELRQVKGTNVKQLLLDAAARNPDVYARRQADFEAGKDPKTVIDVGDFPHIIGHHWREVFRNNTASRDAMRNRMHLIVEGRNQVAHPDAGDIPAPYVSGRLDDIARVLKDINAADAANQVEVIAEELYQKPAVPEPTPQPPAGDLEPTLKTASKSNGLKPWRDVIQPHPDVISGEITNSTFAADLQRVADSKVATDEYTSPIGFFNRSFITPRLQSLLVNTIRRVNGLGGEPVIQMKSGFGGGKTHSLIALYHLINSLTELAQLATDPSDRTGNVLKRAFDQAGVDPEQSVRAKVAVLSGTVRSVTEDTLSEGGHSLNTLWGYMANNLGDIEAYEFVGRASERWTSPGGQELDNLFNFVGPCVILMDELAAYARVLNDDQSAHFYTFLQALTESAARQRNVAIVVTVPEADDAMGGDKGIAAAAKIGKVLGRIESISAPLETQEAFEVVRRRLFEDSGVDIGALEHTAESFGRMYTKSRREYPRHVSNHEYVERIKSCYPIHPELFDRLFDDWAGIPGFQKTRGVLRLMAIAIRRLHNTASEPLIMPGSLRFSDPNLGQELLKYLPGSWEQAIDEVDGDNSRADRVDSQVGRFQQRGDGAAKRVARTIMFGSVPAAHAGKTRTGLDEEHIRLGTVQPGDGVSVYNEARNRLAKELHHLHSANDLYYFHASPNLFKLHQDILARVSKLDRDDRITKRIQEQVAPRIVQDILVLPCPLNSHEIRDDDQVKLVILHPGMHLPPSDVDGEKEDNDKDSATPFIKDVMAICGDSRRIRRNTLVFLTARRDSIATLRREVANMIAWENLSRNREGHKLNSDQIKEANAQTFASREKVDDLLLSTYVEVIAPTQPDPTKPDFELRPTSEENKTQRSIATHAIEILKQREEVVHEIGHNQFQSMLDDYFWNPGVDHLEISDIWNNITQQVYLPRFVNRDVLETAIRKATSELGYELAEGYDGGHYRGLNQGTPIMDTPRLIVKGEAADAWRQLQAEESPQTLGQATGRNDTKSQKAKDNTPDKLNESHHETRQPTLFTISASKKWSGQAAIDGDYNQFREDIVKGMQRAGGIVEVTITVKSFNDEGFQTLATNSIRQNCDQLGAEYFEGE